MNNFYFDFLNNIIKHNYVMVYIIFFLTTFLQMVFPPLPGDLLLVYQGYLTYYYDYSAGLLLLNASIASFLGSIIVYELGYFKGDAVFKYKFVRKFISRKQHIRSKKLFRRFGVIAIFISKFLLGINAVTILFAGIFRLKPKFVYLSLVSSIIIHHVLFLLAGHLLAKNMDKLYYIISTYNKLTIVLTIIVICTSFIIYKRSNRYV